MAQYKVIQDIEAEDKLLGPLSLRQFIYAIIALGCGFLTFKLITSVPFLALPFVFPTILFGFLAAPFSHDQTSEVWLLAKIRFALKPRRRIWDQTGMQQLVTITVPKKIERVFTDGLSQKEVRSRLGALANTLDSRGWAVKNVNVNLFAQPNYLIEQQNTDRLVDASMLPQDVPAIDVAPADDMLDSSSNMTAQHFEELISSHARNRLEQLKQQVAGPATSQKPATAPNWMTEPAVPTASSLDDKTLTAQLKAKKANPANQRLHTVVPATQKTDKPPVPDTQNPAILGLAKDDNLSVATIAKEANKAASGELSDGEVIVSLH
jgi:hypothetical protein